MNAELQQGLNALRMVENFLADFKGVSQIIRAAVIADNLSGELTAKAVALGKDLQALKADRDGLQATLASEKASTDAAVQELHTQAERMVAETRADAQSRIDQANKDARDAEAHLSETKLALRTEIASLLEQRDALKAEVASHREVLNKIHQATGVR